MKKKTIIIIAISIILVAVAIGGYSYYKYNYIDELTEYYYLNYTPPIEKISYSPIPKLSALMSPFEKVEYTDPKVDIGKLPQYSSDSAAIAIQTKQKQEKDKTDREELEKRLKMNPSSDDYAGLAEKEAIVELCRQNLATQHFIITFTHHRSYNPEDFFTFIKKNGMNWQKLKEFCEKNDLKGNYYQI